MADSGTYMFGITLAPRARDGPMNVEMPEGYGELRFLAEGDITAVVSTYTGPTLAEIPQEDLLRHLVTHQKAIELATRRHPVLPVRVGTVVANDRSVALALRTSAGLLSETYARFEDLVELDVAATWDLDAVLADVASDPDVAAARLRGQNAAEDQRQPLAIETGKVVAAKLDERRMIVQGCVVDALSATSVDVQHNVLVSDDLVCNSAFLVREGSVADFDEALASVDKQLGGEYNFRRVGPLPTYSFATLLLHEVTPQRLDSAREILGLATECDQQAIEAAYRTIAVTAHPDVNPADERAAERFQALRAARSDLLTALRHGGNDATSGSLLYFSVERSSGRP